ncbi:MAG: hypothetical protein NTV34_13960 [Proteobacteria bacterium]|nr:hypothetical protein [Pseudomonadota bacterium]
MKEMTIKDALQLANTREATSISLFLNTDQTGRDGAKITKRNLEKLYKSLERMFPRACAGSTKMDRILGSLKASLSRITLNPSTGGLAIFHNEYVTGFVRLSNRTTDLAIAAQSFHLKPILRSSQIRRSYYVLALRKHCADLYLVTPEGLSKVTRINLTEKNSHADKQKKLTRVSPNNQSFLKRDMLLDDRMISLRGELAEHLLRDKFPLMLSGPEHLQKAFRKRCEYDNLIAQSLDGDIACLHEKVLMEQSRQVFEAYLVEADNNAVENYLKATREGLTSNNIAEIGVAIARGQVKSLIIAEDRHVWGHFDRTSGSFEILHERNEALADDLLDDFAELTLQKGGNVTVLPSSQMPNQGSIVAVLRWSDSIHCDDKFLPMRSRSHLSSLAISG